MSGTSPDHAVASVLLGGIHPGIRPLEGEIHARLLRTQRAHAEARGDPGGTSIFTPLSTARMRPDGAGTSLVLPIV